MEHDIQENETAVRTKNLFPYILSWTVHPKKSTTPSDKGDGFGDRCNGQTAILAVATEEIVGAGEGADGKEADELVGDVGKKSPLPTPSPSGSGLAQLQSTAEEEHDVS
uniref:Uncharacterized protein n=1 Tax=Oryza punctata TaxID=4537 RepID=A0A0E0MMM2_ORYPU